MVMIAKTTTTWTGFLGAPGYTNFYFSVADPIQASIDAAASRVANFFLQLVGVLPSSVTVTTLQSVEIIDALNGRLSSIETSTQAAKVDGGTKVGSYSAPSGGLVSWTTGGIHRNRRVRGRTFIVPLSGDSYEPDGSLTGPAMGALRAAAGSLSGVGPTHVVWARPHRTPTKPPVVTFDGDAFAVTGFIVPDKTVVLRSRRD